MVEIAIYAQVLVWLLFVGVFFTSGQASIFHPITWYLAFHGLVFVLRPILVHYFHFDSVWIYMRLAPEPEDFIRTLAVSSLGLAVLFTTCLGVGRTRSGFPGGSPPAFAPAQNSALILMTIVLLPIIAYSIRAAGGDTGGELQANGVYILTKTTGYVLDAQFMLAPLLCLWLLKTRFHWLNLVPILIYIGYRSWCGWARWTILLFFLTLLLQYCWYYRLRWLPVWTLVAALPILVLFNMLGHNRGILQGYLKEGTLEGEQFNPTLGMSAEEKRKQNLDTQDFANFDYLEAVVSIVPKRTGMFTYGCQYLQLFTEPIPRILWPGKPAGAPVAFFNLNQYANFMGLTVSLVGDGWMNGGWFGVVITLGIAGLILGLAHRSFWARSNLPIPSMLFITFLGVSPNWFRDGGISVFKFLMFTWLPLLLLPALTWLIEGRVVRGSSILLHGGQQLRIIQAEPGCPTPPNLAKNATRSGPGCP
jgi:hypothetical protein